MDHDPSELLALATDMARQAGQLLCAYAERGGLSVDTKTSATDPVSAADQASEHLISERIRTARPDDGQLGEEQTGDREGSTGLRWVVDPLDGTVNYLYGIPQWSVSIAVEDAEGPLAGVVHDPSRGDVFTAVRGAGAHHNGEALSVRTVDDPADALVATGFAYDPAARADQGRLLADLIGSVRDVRRFGSAALDLAWLAAGRWDGYAEFTMHRWDFSAGSLLVSEAGGRVDGWQMELGGAMHRGLTAGGVTVVEHLNEWLRRAGARRLPLSEYMD
ncbi:MAG TPA: inositol monophosphatase family protein [Euzebyales bacterium]